MQVIFKSKYFFLKFLNDERLRVSKFNVNLQIFFLKATVLNKNRLKTKNKVCEIIAFES